MKYFDALQLQKAQDNPQKPCGMKISKKGKLLLKLSKLKKLPKFDPNEPKD